MNDKPTLYVPIPEQPEPFTLAGTVPIRPITLDSTDRLVQEIHDENTSLVEGLVARMSAQLESRRPDWPHTIETEVINDGEQFRVRATFTPTAKRDTPK